MSVKVQKGAVKFNSIAAMVRTICEKTGEPYARVYIRTWKRLKEAEKSASVAFHAPKRKYVMQEGAAA